MKGAIVDCIEELIKKKFGKENWETILKDSGLELTFYLASDDIEDSKVFNIIHSICKINQMSLEQVFDAFGDYWVNEYAPKFYQFVYEECSNAKEFLLKMDQVHEEATSDLPNSNPPRFTYSWKNSNTLIMHYNSKRNLIDLMISLIKGVGKYYKENLKIRKIDEKKVEIQFSV